MSSERLNSPPPTASKPVLPSSLPRRPPSLVAPKPIRGAGPTWTTYDVEQFYQAPVVRQMATAPREPPPVAPSFYSRHVTAALTRNEAAPTFPFPTAGEDDRFLSGEKLVFERRAFPQLLHRQSDTATAKTPTSPSESRGQQPSGSMTRPGWLSVCVLTSIVANMNSHGLGTSLDMYW